MFRSYEIDVQAAKKADEKSARISTTGHYIGTFKHAIARTSTNKGTEGVELHFETADKQEAKFTLWTFKGTGEPLSGFNTLQAILTCLQIRGINAAPTRVELYDRNTGGKSMQNVHQYTDLIGKPIGLLLQLAPEEYVKHGTVAIANKMEIFGVYQANSNLVASEILNKSGKPEKLPKMIAALKDRQLKKLPAQVNVAGNDYESVNSGNFSDFEDDIPF
ncbi:hypothetical protein [Chitinimonas sp. BJB300]|uniref:hypothetical protein n=1 Tax=Chitinimonas sp. BJB300 TaxID=1559339 RepID=UPI000C0F8C6A|nr:hypothetical protein [Chitinimonas sp. BJB300]PHV12076.1 hypothetical protein CSQ89_07630 [Chitinimonas sp. BJB300]TSJ87320.1 hypothetical protein FG002_013825 [Chitinimonas sp. BJB300]